MKVFIDWALAQRFALVLIAIAFAPLLPFVTAALMIVNTLHRGTTQGIVTALIGMGLLAFLGVVTAGAWAAFAVNGAVAMAGGVALGAMLNYGRALVFGFQGTVLACYLLACAVSLYKPGTAALTRLIQDRVQQLFVASGATPEALDLLQVWDTMLLGMVFGAVFAQLVGALLLGYWWFALASGRVRFGVEFRALKLGRVLGIAAMVLLTLSLVVDAPVVENLTVIALVAFLFQGLAVMHAWAHEKKWHAAVLWPVYVLFITPWTLIPVLGLSAVGLLDNIFEMRPPKRAQD